MKGQDFTVIGAGGFLGRELEHQLQAAGHRVRAVGRDSWPPKGSALGHVLFAAGTNSASQSNVRSDYDSHVLALAQLLRDYELAGLTYLSSTRLYAGAAATHEQAALVVQPHSPSHSYNIAKLAGENLCLTSGHPNARVVRLANVFGAGDPTRTFLAEVLRSVARSSAVTIHQPPESAKDYVPLGDAVAGVIAVATGGREPIYNIASGINVSHAEIASLLTEAGFDCQFSGEGRLWRFLPIETTLYERDFGPVTRDPLAGIAALVRQMAGESLAQ
jgi:nucleoside-diphosphate-sugar epimerase